MMLPRILNNQILSKTRSVALIVLLAFSLFMLAGFALQHRMAAANMAGCDAGFVQKSDCINLNNQSRILEHHLGTLHSIAPATPATIIMLLLIVGVGFFVLALCGTRNTTQQLSTFRYTTSPPRFVSSGTLHWLALLEKRDPGNR